MAVVAAAGAVGGGREEAAGGGGGRGRVEPHEVGDEHAEARGPQRVGGGGAAAVDGREDDEGDEGLRGPEERADGVEQPRGRGVLLEPEEEELEDLLRHHRLAPAVDAAAPATAATGPPEGREELRERAERRWGHLVLAEQHHRVQHRPPEHPAVPVLFPFLVVPLHCRRSCCPLHRPEPRLRQQQWQRRPRRPSRGGLHATAAAAAAAPDAEARSGEGVVPEHAYQGRIPLPSRPRAALPLLPLLPLAIISTGALPGRPARARGEEVLADGVQEPRDGERLPRPPQVPTDKAALLSVSVSLGFCWLGWGWGRWRVLECKG